MTFQFRNPNFGGNPNNGEISMSRTTACLTRIAASEQFFI
ncbi:hypothetical protein AB8L52_004100, partial [Shigella flexneri]